MSSSPKLGSAHRLSPSPEQPKTKKPRLDKKQLKRRRGKPEIEACSPEDVLWHDVISLLGDSEDKIGDASPPFDKQETAELEISALTSDGRGLALVLPSSPDNRPWVIVVPSSLPGERVRAKIYKHEFGKQHSFADFIEILRPNEDSRDDKRAKCQYFTKCGGCQYQMLSYPTQLNFKREVIVKAYKNFSNLSPSSIPEIQPTMGSPLEYGYRTKITPHFQAPPRGYKPSPDNDQKPDWLKIGFNLAGQNRVIDIEECPIATPAINDALPSVRKDIIEKIHTYKKGATLLLRDSLEPPTKPADKPADDNALSDAMKHVCITSPHDTIHTRIGQFIFEYGASSFFQNNDSVLPLLVDYVREAIFVPWSTSATDTTSTYPRPTHLIDTYCGSGLFAICLSPHFHTIAGIEISRESIKAAKRNAELNEIPQDKLTFREGDAEGIFDAVRSGDSFPKDQTTILIDPPRKGCSASFISQLVDFGAATVVYVSCNVHTQARDIGMILGRTVGNEKRYVLESLRGFDLFPQTAHVESVAVLRLV